MARASPEYREKPFSYPLLLPYKKCFLGKLFLALLNLFYAPGIIFKQFFGKINI